MTRLLMVVLIAVLMSCNASEEKFDAASYEEAKVSLEDREKRNPERFLQVTGDKKKNIIGQTVIRGNIRNTASVCTYKDVQLKLVFYSKTGVMLEENKETIYEIVAPNTTVDFKTKYFAPKGTDSVAMTVLGATVESVVK